MPIKKRKSVPAADAPTPDAERASQPLHIEAKPKKPVPQRGVVREILGPNPPRNGVLRLGPLALDSGADTADEGLTIEDRVALMRTPYDLKNPQEQRYRNRVRGRGTAITAMCITCQGGRKAVTECIDTTCPLWAFRFGSDPFYGKRKK